MKTQIDTPTRSLFWQLFNLAFQKRLITMPLHHRKAFLARANRALRANLAEPGDCAGDMPLIVGLSLAQAEIGHGAGWIPVVQKLGCEIADLIK